jgi:hypothetical protein
MKTEITIYRVDANREVISYYDEDASYYIQITQCPGDFQTITVHQSNGNIAGVFSTQYYYAIQHIIAEDADEQSDKEGEGN